LSRTLMALVGHAFEQVMQPMHLVVSVTIAWARWGTAQAPALPLT